MCEGAVFDRCVLFYFKMHFFHVQILLYMDVEVQLVCLCNGIAVYLVVGPDV